MSAPVIYYIRHGETAWNAEGRFQGSRDIPLNDLGRTQAVTSGGILADLLARDGRDSSSLPFVASPLGRARLTMELMRGTMNLPPDDYAIDDRLREIGYGQWEGLTLPEMQLNDAATFASRNEDKWGVAAPSGESYASVTLRMREWFDAQQVQRLWDEHARMKRDHGLKLFGLLSVGLFLDSAAYLRTLPSDTPQRAVQALEDAAQSRVDAQGTVEQMLARQANGT